MEKIDILMERADSNNGFSKQAIRKYSFTISFKNFHELSVMFECLHKEDLHPSKIAMIDNRILNLQVSFVFEEGDKVRNLVKKLVDNNIRILA